MFAPSEPIAETEKVTRKKVSGLMVDACCGEILGHLITIVPATSWPKDHTFSPSKVVGPNRVMLPLLGGGMTVVCALPKASETRVLINVVVPIDQSRRPSNAKPSGGSSMNVPKSLLENASNQRKPGVTRRK